VHVDATRMRFSPHQCLAFDGGPADLRCLRVLIDHLASVPGLAVAIDGDGALLRYVVEHFPSFRDHVRYVIVERVPADGRAEFAGLPVVLADEMPHDVKSVFLCETRAYPRQRMRKWLGEQARLIDLDVLPELAIDQIPVRAWVPTARDVIYPIDLPDIEFRSGM